MHIFGEIGDILLCFWSDIAKILNCNFVIILYQYQILYVTLITESYQ